MRFKSRLVNLHVNAREGVCIYVRVYVEVGGFIDAPESTKVPLKDRTTDLEMSSVEKELSCESDRSLINWRPFVTLAGRKIRRRPRRRRRPTFPSLCCSSYLFHLRGQREAACARTSFPI